ncbi:P-loop containing nucleoside triphosphate hydrolase protein [Lentinula raphanica]|uniref:P-loop containing nucleoside triphosphate hydrolase protein n=1 Tax=Lentinula raphanica TaxID=153919 RepID=A0AA38U8Q8_9AGAR|nr:P-loop containing nucleoside triphosphate hydrolase protein [Lentinula raphanica]
MLHLAGLSYKITAAIRDNLNIWTTLQNWLLPLNGLAHLIALFSNSYFQDSAKLLILGSIVEAGRRLFQWFLERFRIQYSITAEFAQGDPAYEWLSHFLNHEEVWRRACDFRVSSKNSSRKWGISAGKISELVKYVPTYLRPQLFRWRGYRVEISQVQEDSGGPFGHSSPGLHYPTVSTMYLTIYTLDMSAMSAIIEEAHQRYLEVSKADVIVHEASDHHHVGSWDWVKRQRRRPFSSIILQEGVLETILQDVKEFFATEAWYIERGIPHRRGYLLHGPPGSGKSSTICALAGELGLEIYTLSLASNHIDDLYLQRAADSIPKNCIFVIKDIDCAMPSWDVDEDASQMAHPQIMMNWRSPLNRTRVTLSTLLNVIDGLGSEEGRLFFTTTNHIDQQAATLFMHFFPPASAPSINPHSKAHENGILDKAVTHETQMIQLSKTFASHIPPNEFSIADLLGYKDQPERAAVEFSFQHAAWAEQEREFKRQAEEKAARKKMKKEITEVKSSKP